MRPRIRHDVVVVVGRAVVVVLGELDAFETTGGTIGVTPYFFKIDRPVALSKNFTNAFAAVS